MDYEMTLIDTTTHAFLCDLATERPPSPAEADYLATCVHDARTGSPDAMGPSGLTAKAVQEALKAFNQRYPLKIKHI